jgi:hypothetical protein
MTINLVLADVTDRAALREMFDAYLAEASVLGRRRHSLASLVYDVSRTDSAGESSVRSAALSKPRYQSQSGPSLQRELAPCAEVVCSPSFSCSVRPAPGSPRRFKMERSTGSAKSATPATTAPPADGGAPAPTGASRKTRSAGCFSLRPARSRVRPAPPRCARLASARGGPAAGVRRRSGTARRTLQLRGHGRSDGAPERRQGRGRPVAGEPSARPVPLLSAD